MFSTVVTGAMGVGKWIMDSPVAKAVIAVIVFIIGYEIVKGELEKAGAKKERKEQKRRNAEEQVKIVTKRQEITTEIINDTRKADEAVVSVRGLDGPTELRRGAPSVADELLGPTRRSPG